MSCQLESKMSVPKFDAHLLDVYEKHAGLSLQSK